MSRVPSKPDRAEREELRIALVMNGGVSLAVWMGGVTEEIFRLVTKRHPVYEKLLDITHTDARVDVISGTSAGGVNGAALTLAMLYGQDFAQLREVWMQTGAFTDLLRSPLGSNPGSLLQGDEFFLPQIEKAFASLAGSDVRVASPETTPIDLRLTTTLLTGRQVRTVDTLGTPVNDVDYRAHFHFEHGPSRSDLDDPATFLPKLSRAARSTASFPFAFEPSLLTKENTGDHLKDFRDGPLQVPRYVIDGGILNNKPFEGARRAIASMRTDRSVRRVLAYINPDPGDGPPGKIGGKRPELAKVLVEGVFAIPSSQTIADQLDAIETHNDAVHKRRDSILTLVALERPKLVELASQLYDVYYKRRLASTFEIFVYQQLSAAAERKPALAAGLRAVGNRRRSQMKQAFIAFGEPHPGSAASPLGWLPGSWSDGISPDGLSNPDWAWGLFPVEFSARMLLDLLRRTQRLLDGGRPMPASPVSPALHAGLPDCGDWSDPGQDPPLETDDPHAPRTATGSEDDKLLLTRLWRFAFRIQKGLEAMRRREQADHWNDGAEALLGELMRLFAPGSPPIDLTGILATTLYPEMFGFLDATSRRRRCARIEACIVAAIRRLCALADRVVAAHERQLGLASSVDRQKVAELGNLVRALEDGGSHRATLVTLLSLEVVQYAFDDHETLAEDTAIELVQISGNGESPLGGKIAAKEKLLGLQLAHFGAFYKRSWRANDWIYGRLTGAERLVRLLLDPERLYRCFADDRAGAIAAIVDVAIGSVGSERLRQTLLAHWTEHRYAERIDRELAFLDVPNVNLPDALPYCTGAITLRLHYGILENELPGLLDAIQADQVAGAEPVGPGETMLRELKTETQYESGASGRYLTPELARRWLQSGLLGSETLLGEAGSDLFTRTLSHATATLQNTIASKATGLGPVSAFFATLKLPILGFWLSTKGLLAQSRTGAAVNGGVLVLGMALVLLEFLWKPTQLVPDNLPHAVVATGWALLAYGLVVSALRTPLTFTALLAAVLLAMVARGGSDRYLPFVAVLALVCAGVWITWLQWLTGLLAVLVAAAWGSGLLSTWLPPASPSPAPDYQKDVLVFAGVIVATLAWAVLQSTASARRLTEAFFALRLGFERGDDLYFPRAGLRIATTDCGWWPRMMGRVEVREVQSLSIAAEAGLEVGDRIVAIHGEAVDGMTRRRCYALLWRASRSPLVLRVERGTPPAAATLTVQSLS